MHQKIPTSQMRRNSTRTWHMTRYDDYKAEFHFYEQVSGMMSTEYSVEQFAASIPKLFIE